MTSSASESEAKKKSRTRGAGPRLKNGGGVWSTPYTLVVGEDRAEVLHLLERVARAAHAAGERVVGHDHRQPGLLHQQPVEVAQQRASPGEHHAFLGDVRAELGGVCSSADFTAETIWFSGSVSASRISFDEMVKLRGMPSARLRPFTSISRTSLPGKAEPISFLIISAVVSPLSIP